ncbi:MAG: response regulator, partial [Alphaproteobacteria bacterium]
MKIMVIDRDRGAIEEIKQICGDIPDVDLVIEPIKNNALDALRAEKYDAVFFDPAPQNELRPFVIGARRGISHYNPIVVLSHQLDQNTVRSQGANDVLPKPFDATSFKKRLENMRNLNMLIARLEDDSIDFPSKDGVISKSAFYQIFISCLDRADRYGEETYLTFSSIANIDEITAEHGADIANEVCENLKKYTMRIRRLSDIAGRTAPEEICLMLSRPANAEEPKMAISRFAESMAEYAELIPVGDAKPVIRVTMLAIPTGEVTFEKDFTS